MRRYPRTQRAIVAELKHARLKAGFASARALSLAMSESHNYIWLIESLQADPSGAEIYAICQKLKLRAATFWARVERRLRT